MLSVFLFFYLSYFILFFRLRIFLVFSNYRLYIFQTERKCRRGIITLMSISEGFGPTTFQSKYGEKAYYDGRDVWKCCLLPAIIGILTSML